MPLNIEPFVESVARLRNRIDELLISVGRCADVVDQLNKLKDLRNHTEDELGTLRCNPPKENATEQEVVAYRNHTGQLTARVEALTQEIDQLYSPFQPTQEAVRMFMEQLPGVLSTTEIEGIQRRMSSCIPGRLSMGSAYHELEGVKRRLDEFHTAETEQLSQGPGGGAAKIQGRNPIPPQCGPRSVCAPQAADRVQKYMHQHGLNRSQFAKFVRTVSAKTVGKLLNTGVATPSVLEEIAVSMGTTKAKLLGAE